MKFEKFVEDQKARMKEFKEYFDEQEKVIQEANKNQHDALKRITTDLEAMVESWDKNDLSEYWKVANADSDVLAVEMQMVMKAYINTHQDDDDIELIEKAMVLNMTHTAIDLLADLLF